MIYTQHGGTQGGLRRVTEITRQGPRPRLVGSALSIRRTETRAQRTLDASPSQPSAEVRGMLFPPGRSPQGRVPAAGGALRGGHTAFPVRDVDSCPLGRRDVTINPNYRQ